MGREYLLLISIFFSGMIQCVYADDLTPETFVLADLESRSVTLEGMEARLSILQQGVGLDDQSVVDEANRAEVEAIFERYGTTGVSHTLYGSQNKSEIEAFLETRPDLQEQYSELKQRFITLLNQFGD